MRRTIMTLFVAGAIGLCGALPVSARGAATFHGLGRLPDKVESYATDISDDGLVVVGYSRMPLADSEAFRWTAAGGMTGLGQLPGGSRSSEALGTSSDGSVVVGRVFTFGDTQAFRWTAGDGMQSLLNGESDARAASSDGNVVVGWHWATKNAFRWTAAGGMVDLGVIAGWGMSEAKDVSADGSVVVGAGFSAVGYAAFRWTADSGMINLGDLPGGMELGYAQAVSADGTVVAGESWSAAGQEGFRWTANEGISGLGFLPGGKVSAASGISADGSVIIGTTDTDAFIWTESGGIQGLTTLLGTALPSGWRLTDLQGVSVHDGLITVVGTGINPEGNNEAFIATIPEPAGMGTLVGGIALLARRRRPQPPRA